MSGSVAVVYCRVSSWSQAKGDGIRRQLHQCLQYCAANHLEVVGVFTDIGSGAGSLPGRDAARRFANYNQATVVMEAPDRWTRASNVQFPDAVLFSSPCVDELTDRLGALFRAAMKAVES